MRTDVLALGILMCMSQVPVQAEPSCSQQSCIRVGSFNIRLLGSGGPDDNPATQDTDIDRVSRVIDEQASLDLAVLQEVNVQSEEWRELKRQLEERGYNADHASSSGGERD